MADIDDEWGEGGFDDEPSDPFAADVTTVDAQDTLDVSAQFFRVCARIYMDNPLHNPVYEWLSRLPRTGNGNIKAISDHLVLALRLYVDTLNSGSALRLGPADLPEDGYSPSSVTTTRLSVSPSQRYRQSRIFREGLQSDVDSPAPSSAPSRHDHPVTSSSASPSGQPNRQDPSRAALPTEPASPARSPSPSVQAAPQSSAGAPSTSSSVTPDGLSFVARLTREGDGW
jgi:hypothetical protein